MKVQLIRGTIRQNGIINSADDAVFDTTMMFSGEIYAAMKKSDDRTGADLALLSEAMRQGTLWIYNSPKSDADIKEATECSSSQ